MKTVILQSTLFLHGLKSVGNYPIMLTCVSLFGVSLASKINRLSFLKLKRFGETKEHVIYVAAQCEHESERRSFRNITV